MSRFLTVCFSFLAAFILAGPLAAQNGCEYRRELSDALHWTAAGPVSIDAGAGSLRITGRAGLLQVVVTGTACASSASRLDEMELDTGIRGGGVYVGTVIPESRSWFGQSESGRIDLVVEVPEGATLDVKDGSGSIQITSVRGGLRIDDGSGSLEITHVSGGLQVDDGSGSLTIRDVDGDVRLLDGSGSITIENVRGNVVVEDDGSGSMGIRDVTGTVLVREDGSGGITVEHAGGDFIVDRDGSGGIRFADIAGSVQVPRQ